MESQLAMALEGLLECRELTRPGKALATYQAITAAQAALDAYTSKAKRASLSFFIVDSVAFLMMAFAIWLLLSAPDLFEPMVYVR
jgi:hypothetical protein